MADVLKGAQKVSITDYFKMGHYHRVYWRDWGSLDILQSG
jgi:hypothetical protein